MTEFLHYRDQATETRGIVIPRDFPTVVCLIGSTRFYEQFREATFAETLAGKIVLSIGFYPKDDNPHWQANGITPEQKAQLDELHLRKIDLADEVLVLNVGGYIGESTRRELEYAVAKRKRIRFRGTLRMARPNASFDELRAPHDETPWCTPTGCEPVNTVAGSI